MNDNVSTMSWHMCPPCPRSIHQHKKPPEVKTVVALPKKALPAPPAFHCEGKVYCSQMGSRAEANFYLAHCPGTKMDGDNDGIPCENDSRW